MRDIWDFYSDNHLKARKLIQRDKETQPSQDFSVGDRVALKTLSGPKFRKTHFQTGFYVVNRSHSLNRCKEI